MGKFIKMLVLAVFVTSASFAYVSAAPQGAMKPATEHKDKKEKKKKEKKKKEKKKKEEKKKEEKKKM